MSEEKWTQGEWRVSTGIGYCAIRTGCMDEKTGGVIADMRLVDGYYNPFDAHLISSSPKLYNALKAAMEFIDANVGDPDLTDEMVEAWSRLQDANPHEALAKARGES